MLSRYPHASLRVYVVWVKRWGTDSRAEIDGGGMVDPRVTHLWDTGGGIGTPFLERFGVDLDGLDYDFFLLFGPEATWDSSPPRPLRAGGTVISASDQLAGGVAPLLG